MAEQKTMSFPVTRQGVRNLDAVRENVVPVGGNSAPVPGPNVNTSPNEQWASAAVGAALAVLGLSRGGLAGLLAAAAGGALIYRGISGHCAVYRQLGIDHAQHDTTRESAYIAG